MKNKVRKQILKTLAVGMSACMAFQPVTVMAEGLSESEPDSTKEEKTVEQTDEFSDNADKAMEEIKDAMDAVGSTTEEGTSAVTSEGVSEEKIEGTSEGASEEKIEEKSAGTSEETVPGTSEGISEGTSENAAVTPPAENANSTPSGEAAKNTENNNENISDAITETQETSELVKKIDTDAVIGEKVDLTDETAKLDKAVNYLDHANEELKKSSEAVAEAKKANEVILSDIKTTNEKLDDSIGVLDKGTVNKNENGEPAIGEDGMPELNGVDEYADAVADSGNAEALFNESVAPADTATDEYKNVEDGANSYVENKTALTDTTGEILKQLENDAKKADGNLEDAENKVEKAQADLNKAVKEKDAADKAYDEAKALFDEAVDAFNKSSDDAVAKYGKEAEDDEIDHLYDLSAKVVAANRGVYNAQQYIKNDYELNNAKITSARKEMEQAEKNVNDKLKALQDARYEELVQLQKNYDEATDDKKDEAREELAKKVIEYYGLSDEEGTISNVNFISSQAYADGIGVKNIDGKECYISGYDEGHARVYTEIPTSQAVTYNVTRTVDKADGTKEEVTETRIRTFEVLSDNDGKISIREVAKSNVGDTDSSVVLRETDFKVPVPEHYEDSEGHTVVFGEGAEKCETTDIDGKRTMHVLDSKTETGFMQTGTKLEGENVVVQSESQYEYKDNLFTSADNGSDGSLAGIIKTTTERYTKTDTETTKSPSGNMTELTANKELEKAINSKKISLDMNEQNSSIVEDKNGFKTTVKTTENPDGTVTKISLSGYIDSCGNESYRYVLTVKKETTSTVVTTANYRSTDYAFVSATEVPLTYYELGGYTTVDSSALSNSIAAYEIYHATVTKALDDAKNAFADTTRAYDKAQQEVAEAKKAVEAMSNSGIYGQLNDAEWPQAFTDAKERLEQARLKLDEASKNKAAAEEALEKAEIAKDKADSAVKAAKEAQKSAYEALDKAKDAKKTVDDEKAAEEEKKAKEEQAKKDEEARKKAEEDRKAQEEAERAAKEAEEAAKKAQTTIEDEQTPTAPSPIANNTRFTPSVSLDTLFSDTDSDTGQSTSSDDTSNIGETVEITSTSYVIQTANLSNILGETNTLSNPSADTANGEAVGEEAAAADTATNATDSKSSVNTSDKAETPAAVQDKAAQSAPVSANIEDDETAKSATPVEEQKGRFPWMVAAFAAIAGISVEEYLRRKNAAKASGSKENTRKVG